MDIPPRIPSPNDDDNDHIMTIKSQNPQNTNTSGPLNTIETQQTQNAKHHHHHPPRACSLPLNNNNGIHGIIPLPSHFIHTQQIASHNEFHKKNTTSNGNTTRRRRKSRKKRCAALDYLSDSPKKKRGRKVKDRKNMPPIQKQPFFLVFPDLRLKCPQCDHIAICQGTLVQHLRTHPTSRKCPECNKIFSTQQNLIKHARLHTGERPYPCPIEACKWAYKQKGDLLAHIQRGKHGTSSDNNRKPPPLKLYHGSLKLPTLHAISKQDVMAAPDLQQLIVALRKREEMKKKQKEKVKQKRKAQLDDFVLSMFLSIYDIDNHEMKNLLKIARSKYKEKVHKKEERTMETEEEEEEEEETIIDTEYLKIDSLPTGKKVNIKFKYLVNRVYGDYSIVLVPVNSVPPQEIYEETPEIVIDPKLIPALNRTQRMAIDDVLNEIEYDRSASPPAKKQRLNNNGQIHMPRKRQYHKYNQTAEGYWQCDAPNCGSLFVTKELLESHCKELHDCGYYGCKYCERIYRSQKNVQNHLKKAHGKHGDEYLNALIYNKFHQIIRLKESTWQSITKQDLSCNDQRATVHSIVFKTHPIDHTILRQEHDSEKEGDEDQNEYKLVPWTMQDKSKKSGRGRGRPRVTRYLSEYMKPKGARPRGRPKGSKNKPKKDDQEQQTPKKRGRGRPKGSKNKKKKKKKIEEEEEEETTSDSYDYKIGTIYDDLDCGDEQSSVCKDEQSILVQDLRHEERKKKQKKKKKKKKRGRKRKRREIESDDDELQIKEERIIKEEGVLRLPTFDVAPRRTMTDILGLPSTATTTNTLPSISSLFELPNNLDIPMPAMPSLNSTAAELNGLLNQIDGANIGNVDYNSIIESLFSSAGTSSQHTTRAPSASPHSHSHSHHHHHTQSTINQLNQINTLNQLNNQLNSNAFMNNNNAAMLNNYGNIVNNNYLLKKKENEERDGSESPFVPPLVEAVCGAPGCVKTKRDDGKPLLMCGRCFNIKYCSKRCQLAHIQQHRAVCKKKGATTSTTK